MKNIRFEKVQPYGFSNTEYAYADYRIIDMRYWTSDRNLRWMVTLDQELLGYFPTLSQAKEFVSQCVVSVS